MHLKHCFCNIVKLRIPLGTILPSLQVQVQGRLENRKKKKKRILELHKWHLEQNFQITGSGESIIARILKSVSIDCKKAAIQKKWANHKVMF